MRALIECLLGVAIVLAGITNLLQQHDIKQLTQSTVYAVCNQARQEVNGASEQACGDIQDQTGTEFLCRANNMKASTHCWVEVK